MVSVKLNNLTPLISLSFLKERGKNMKRGAVAPLRHPLTRCREKMVRDRQRRSIWLG
jgi:hypothetical protein